MSLHQHGCTDVRAWIYAVPLGDIVYQIDDHLLDHAVMAIYVSRYLGVSKRVFVSWSGCCGWCCCNILLFFVAMLQYFLRACNQALYMFALCNTKYFVGYNIYSYMYYFIDDRIIHLINVIGTCSRNTTTFYVILCIVIRDKKCNIVCGFVSCNFSLPCHIKVYK